MSVRRLDFGDDEESRNIEAWTSVVKPNPFEKQRVYYNKMAIDIGWAVSVSLTGIAITVVLLAVINIKLKRSNQNNTKTNGIVKWIKFSA